MSKNISAVRAIVRQFLNDEFVSGSDQDFKDDELDLYINDCLVEISERKPYEVKETLTTTASSKELDISSIEDLLEVEKIEYKTGQDPPDYRNHSVFGDTLTMDIDFNPSADEDVYLYCHKVHQLTESSSTLKPRLERLLVNGVVAYAALGWINQVRVQVKEAVSKIAGVDTAIGNMSARITQAIADLTSGRPLIDETRATADAAIDLMSARITQAMADLTSGRSLINQVSIGGRPQADYAAYAARELDNAVSYLNQARGYLAVDTPAGQYGNYAAKELSNATGYLNQAGGYIRELSARLSVSGVINSYQTWANNKLALYKQDLRQLVKTRVSTVYPKS